jgi:hypothetical protein
MRYMEKSKIINPSIKEIWLKSVWTGQPESSVKERIITIVPPLIFCAVGVLVAGLIANAVNSEDVMGVGISAVALASAVWMFKLALASRWKDPTLMFAITDNRVFFTGESYAKMANNGAASWFEEALTNVESFTKKNDKDKTTVILNFREKSYAGSYGNLKALPLFRISNAEGLISILTGLGIKENEEK